MDEDGNYVLDEEGNPIPAPKLKVPVNPTEAPEELTTETEA